MSGETRGFSSQTGTLPLPRACGRYLLLKLVARGGMGDVYLAATTGLEGAERPCIVKTVRRDHAHDGSFLARFLDEARVQSQLQHPGVAAIFEAATDEHGSPYTVVEYIEGRSLAEVQKRAVQMGTPLGWPEAVAMALEVASALAHVHERSGPDGQPLGIVHRDLSPQNIMVGYAGEVKLIDFGTARGQNRRCQTVSGVVYAKPGYVAPEVARQQVGDGRIDLYALGVILWELVAGRRFLAGDAQRHLEDVAAGRGRLPPLAAVCGAPGLLDEVIARLTANDPDDRVATAGRAAQDLARVLSAAPPTKTGERGVRPRIACLMRSLWTKEPARARAEFARLLEEARPLLPAATTPSQSRVVQSLAAMDEDPAQLPGTPYRLLRKIGEGATGVVHEAEHVELGRQVAIKILGAEHAQTREAVERFRREARIVAQLAHPGIVALYDFGRAHDGRVYLAMELLRGEPLDRRLRREGTFPWPFAVRLALQAVRALEAAHAKELVHRDLKLANLFVTESGELKLLDFGVATVFGDGGNQAKKGVALFGTPETMAPEQVSGEAVDGRADLYALGCVLYEMVTGTPVFDGASAVEVMGKHLREAPEPLKQRAPDRFVPPALEAIVLRTLAKEKDARFASAAALRQALEEVLAAPVRHKARIRQAATLALGVAALVGIASIGAEWGGQRARELATSNAAGSTAATAMAPAQGAPSAAPATATRGSGPDGPARPGALATNRDDSLAGATNLVEGMASTASSALSAAGKNAPSVSISTRALHEGVREGTPRPALHTVRGPKAGTHEGDDARRRGPRR